MKTGLLLMAAIGLTAATAWTVWRFQHDIALARAHAREGSVVVQTPCGPIEYQEAGDGLPLLMVHGSGGGHDQGMDWARALTQQGVRVIAMSRFGYLRTPRPTEASPQAQADAHVCLLDALGISTAAVMGVCAGAPSAIQTAIRHPDHISALVLVVPIAWKPGDMADSATPVSDDKDAWLMRLLGSDLLFWSALQLAREQVVRHVLATPPELVAAASAEERARVHTLALRILPVSLRAAGLRDDTRLGKSWPATRWSRSARRPWSSVRATTDSEPTPRPDTRRDRFPAPGSSILRKAGTCWSGTTRQCRRRSCNCCSRFPHHELLRLSVRTRLPVTPACGSLPARCRRHRCRVDASRTGVGRSKRCATNARLDTRLNEFHAPREGHQAVTKSGFATSAASGDRIK